MSSTSLADLIPDLQPWAQKLFDVAQRAAAQPRVTSTLRSYADQQRVYQDYISGRSPYPAAVPGTSAHEFGYAFDMVVPDPTNQGDLGTVWMQWGGVYGGRSDPVHFEYPGFTPGVAAVAQTAPVALGTPGSKLDQAVDFVVSLLPGPLARILGRVAIGNAIWQLTGGSEPLLLWYLSHPVEFLRDFYSIVQTIWRSYF